MVASPHILKSLPNFYEPPFLGPVSPDMAKRLEDLVRRADVRDEHLARPFIPARRQRRAHDRRAFERSLAARTRELLADGRLRGGRA